MKLGKSWFLSIFTAVKGKTLYGGMLQKYKPKVRQLFNPENLKELHNFHHLGTTSFSFIPAAQFTHSSFPINYSEKILRHCMSVVQFNRCLWTAGDVSKILNIVRKRCWALLRPYTLQVPYLRSVKDWELVFTHYTSHQERILLQFLSHKCFSLNCRTVSVFHPWWPNKHLAESCLTMYSSASLSAMHVF